MSLLEILGIESPQQSNVLTKTCRLCGKIKPITQFHKSGEKPGWKGKRQPRYVDGYRSECAECRSVNGPAHSGAAGLLMKREGLKRPPMGTPCELCDSSVWMCYNAGNAIKQFFFCVRKFLGVFIKFVRHSPIPHNVC